MKQLPTISNQQLFEQLRQNALLVTVNNRLARRISNDYDLWMSANSEAVVWPSARILPLNTWLELQFEVLHDTGLTELTLLDDFSEKKLWEEIISPGAASFMMKPAAISRQVMQAWRLMQQWQLPISGLSGFSTMESELLQLWSNRFEATCVRLNLISQVSLLKLISQALAEKQIPIEPETGTRTETESKPETGAGTGTGTEIGVIFAGFEDPNKLHDTLTTSLQAIKVNTFRLKPDNINQSISVEKYTDIKAEVTAAALWAKNKLLDNPRQKLAIVIPNLNENRPWIETLFNKTLHPERILPPPYSKSDLFNFSLGIPLTDYPLVHDALITLELLKKEFSLETLSKILNAIYLFGNQAKDADKHKVQKTIVKPSVDLVLKKHGRLNWTLSDLITFCNNYQGTNSPSAFEDWVRRLEAIATISEQFKNQQTPENFSRLFLETWQTMGWPGNKTLNSHEYQQSEKLLHLLQRFRHISQVKTKLSLPEAIRLIRQFATETIYQEQSEQSPLLVSGLLEAAGQQFDALWLSGMDDQTLPQQTPANPLIPLSLQKQYDMPHSSPEREHHYAKHLLEHFIENSVDTVISYPAQEQDKTLRASSLLNDYQHIDKTEFETTHDMSDSVLQPETDNEVSLTRLPEHYPAHGGSGILTSQAQCPFKAAALFRLNANEPETPVDGVSPLDRGIQIHRALELLWQKIKSRQQLIDISSEALHQLINQTLNKVFFNYQNRRPDLYTSQFLQLEKQRLSNLLTEWFELEKQRLPPFKVIATEQKNSIEVGGLLLKTQADRIDELDSGQRIIIDYKTGSSASSKSWQEEVILEPQLPLYSLAEDKTLAALALAQVHEKACQFSGLANQENVLPGVKYIPENNIDGDTYSGEDNSWNQLRETWKNQLTALAEDFRSGSVEINPYNCQFCNLESLCRKHEIDYQPNEMQDVLEQEK